MRLSIAVRLLLNGDNKSGRWWHFAHEADIGIAVASRSLSDAFALAGSAMTAIITQERVQAVEPVDITCSAPDLEGLLVDWINTLVFEIATRRLLFGRFDVQVIHCALTAVAWGEPIDVHRHQPAVEIKGATFTGLQVKQDSEGMWQLRCIVDV